MKFEVISGDCLEVLRTLPNCSVQCCVTSPPYWGLRDYGHDGQIGLEKTPEAYVACMIEVFREVRRVLRNDGTLWLNLGDSYAGSGPVSQQATDADIQHATVGALLNKAQRRVGSVNKLKPKDLVGIPWRVAFALQADGWWLRQDIIWHKPNPMPESVTDRCTKAHEYIFLMSKSERYYFDNKAINEESRHPKDNRAQREKRYVEYCSQNARTMNPKTSKAYKFRNRRSVWSIATQPCKEAHFATFPPKLIEPCIMAGSRESDTILDPFNGAGTTGLVSIRHNRQYIGIELNPDYCEIARRRIQAEIDKTPLLAELTA